MHKTILLFQDLLKDKITTHVYGPILEACHFNTA